MFSTIKRLTKQVEELEKELDRVKFRLENADKVIYKFRVGDKVKYKLRNLSGFLHVTEGKGIVVARSQDKYEAKTPIYNISNVEGSWVSKDVPETHIQLMKGS